MQDNPSPEERLLRLIRGEHRKSPRKGRQAAKNLEASQPEKVIPEKPALKKKPDKKLSLSGIVNLGKIKQHFSFNQVNLALLVILLILGIYLLADFLISSPGRMEKRISALGQVKDTDVEIPVEISSSIKPVTHYTQAVKSRNLFTATGPQAMQDKPSASFLEMVSKLRLQGIISGSNPQAVIEDTKTKQVYFLTPGEFIGDIQLEAILPGKVKLNYYGQEANLAL